MLHVEQTKSAYPFEEPDISLIFGGICVVQSYDIFICCFFYYPFSFFCVFFLLPWYCHDLFDLGVRTFNFLTTIILFLTCWLFVFNQRVVRLTSVCHWSIYNVKCYFSEFPIVTLWEMRVCLMTSHKRNASFCRSFAWKDWTCLPFF